MASMPQLAPTSQTFGYQPLTRVALLDDLVIAGFSGDPSRVATGLLSVFRKNGPAIPTQPVQEIPVNAPHRPQSRLTQRRGARGGKNFCF
jgi:hypothetical protein